MENLLAIRLIGAFDRYANHGWFVDYSGQLHPYMIGIGLISSVNGAYRQEAVESGYIDEKMVQIAYPNANDRIAAVQNDIQIQLYFERLIAKRRDIRTELARAGIRSEER